MLRIDSKAEREIVHKDPVNPGGYHFTSCGPHEIIAEKIKSWAHQEFNNSAVLRNLDHNIRTGQDIFEREQGTNLTKVSIDDEWFFDKNLATILRGHPDMICESEISVVRPNLLYGFLRRVRYFIRRVIYKLSTIGRET
jgi:beta-1,4-mannosyl-glycoprotein beta-1,4-N-acetylglucosaminyltransferase